MDRANDFVGVKEGFISNGHGRRAGYGKRAVHDDDDEREGKDTGDRWSGGLGTRYSDHGLGEAETRWSADGDGLA